MACFSALSNPVSRGELDLKVPLTVRLQGTNVVKGRKILADSGLNINSADSFDEAAKKAVASIQ